jgi:hypothetical protein
MSRIVLCLALLLTACGHSEDEWQAQLARYGQLEQEHAKEKREHAQAQQ